MNILGCTFGAMPMCHGAGGLAGQYAFGARGGCSVVVLGLVKMVLAVALGGSLVYVLDSFPNAILGVMLFFAGLELATVGAKKPLGRVALVTAGMQIGLKSTWMGAVAGGFVHLVQRYMNRQRGAPPTTSPPPPAPTVPPKDGDTLGTLPPVHQQPPRFETVNTFGMSCGV